MSERLAEIKKRFAETTTESYVWGVDYEWLISQAEEAERLEALARKNKWREFQCCKCGKTTKLEPCLPVGWRAALGKKGAFDLYCKECKK